MNVILSVALAAVASCQTAHPAKVMNVTVGSFRASARLVRCEYKRVVGAEMTFVYGDLSIENVGAVAEAFEIDALRLSLDQGLSGGAEVDSVASFLPSIVLKPAAAVRRNVYWAFDGRVPLPKLDEVQLLYAREQAECRGPGLRGIEERQ